MFYLLFIVYPFISKTFKYLLTPNFICFYILTRHPSTWLTFGRMEVNVSTVNGRHGFMRLYKSEKKKFKCAKYMKSVTTVVRRSTPLSCSQSRLSDTRPALARCSLNGLRNDPQGDLRSTASSSRSNFVWLRETHDHLRHL